MTMITRIAANGASLGEARIEAVDPSHLTLHFEGERVAARLAVMAPYRPTVGDTVLAVRQEGACYVIGVLEALGPQALVATGDLELSAPNGKVRISAGDEVQISAGMVTLAAQTLCAVADSLAEEFGRVTRWVRERFDLKAREVTLAVEEDYVLTAQQVLQRAEDRIALDGARIDLG